MAEGIVSLGPAKFTNKGSKEAFMEMITRLNLEPPVVIKPNWSSSLIFTEGDILDWTIAALDGEVLIVESYAAWRNKLFVEYDGPRDDEFLKMLENQKKKEFRENDKWFLKHSGIDSILAKHRVEYLNLSEELWAERVCEPELIAKYVKSRKGPIENISFYGVVPERLYELRGGTLLSLAKPKRSLKAQHVSLTLKNMFGMIPSPWRGKYHGKNDSLLDQNIVDINMLYGSLFEVRGIIESVISTSETLDNFLYPSIHRNLGLIWSGIDTLELDALVSSQLGINPDEVSYLKLAAEKMKRWNEDSVKLGLANPIDFTKC
ncbi:MAG: DUF362 domain-containing protein [Candidatus Thorarchaeota archaeon]|jgi:uncharacterized protein (DUF362 family)